jgi:hypothetical protein
MTDLNKAVFLSYASQDADAAQNLCNALRAAGIEVWFDLSELRGGEVWDSKINEQIRKCRLFIPVISKNTEARDEGYFRREWAAAVDRMRDMAEHKAFLLPVVIDGVRETQASVPERFRQVQWMKLPGGESTAAFVNRVEALMGQFASGTPADAKVNVADRVQHPRKLGNRTLSVTLGVLGLAAAMGGGWLVWRLATPSSADHRASTTAGLAEELLDLLSLVPDLKVPARTSSFYFRTHPTPAPEIAKALGVQHLLEGSVRRSGDSWGVTRGAQIPRLLCCAKHRAPLQGASEQGGPA